MCRNLSSDDRYLLDQFNENETVDPLRQYRFGQSHSTLLVDGTQSSGSGLLWSSSPARAPRRNPDRRLSDKMLFQAADPADAGGNPSTSAWMILFRIAYSTSSLTE